MEVINGAFDDVLPPGQKEFLHEKFTNAHERQNAELNAKAIQPSPPETKHDLSSQRSLPKSLGESDES
jgi:hypothetical protein